MKCYLFRHQHAGIVTSHVFITPPTEEQIAPIRAECERLHGKNGWGKVHEAELCDKEVPSFPERQPISTDVASAVVSIIGTVSAG